jgi:cbb3-type cytochrome oxidase subunit 1
MLVIVGTVPVTGLIAQSILRHLYLLGFVTHLILGMAVRMVPGFLGKNAVAYPKLVNLSFLFISLAIISRILPLWFSMTDILFFRRAYGLSGILAILAIACLGVNLYVTASRQKKKQL